jgi:hypothetical protein
VSNKREAKKDQGNILGESAKFFEMAKHSEPEKMRRVAAKQHVHITEQYIKNETE